MSAVLKENTRLTPLRYHAVQHAYWKSPHRFNVVPAGRRSGKTEIAKRRLTRASLTPLRWAARYFAGAPTRDQAKRIFWEDLKAMVGRDMMSRPPSETDLSIRTVLGNELWVVGLDKPERIEGVPWDGGVLDEFGNMKEKAWGENIRPALSDRKGWCDLIGVPEGRNHYYGVNNKAMAEMKERGKLSEWGSFSWPSKDILPPEEIEAAMRDLDELTFDQEYNASFIDFKGRAYHAFLESTHCAPLKYDPRAPLILCFDFNVEPGVCAIIQEQSLPKQYEHDTNGIALLNRPIIGTGVIGEVYIPKNSNTPSVCRKIIKDFGEHQGQVRGYGDATGGARGSAKVEGSDWDLIEKELRHKYKDRFSLRVKESNPAERARINAVNSRLKSVLGDIRMMVDGVKAPYVVKDLEGTPLLKGGSGEIDKKKSPLLSHISDAIGYYVEYEFPVESVNMQRVTIGGV